MAVFFVTTSIDAKNGPVWFPFSVPAAATVEEAHGLLKADGLLLGRKMFLEGEKGSQTVKRSEPHVLTVAGIRQLGLPHFDIRGGWAAHS